MDDPEQCVTVTVPQLQEVLANGRSEIAAMEQQLIHEAKEREKIEALLEQQKQFAAESAAEASARETELKRHLDQLRAHAAEELNEAKAYLQAQLADANAALSESEEQLSSLREWAATLHEQVAQALESCLHAAGKVDQMVQDATANAQVQHQAAIASAQHQVAAALEARRQAEGRAAAIGLALAADRELLLRAQVLQKSPDNAKEPY
jgi:chromosome segregation ATPase